MSAETIDFMTVHKVPANGRPVNDDLEPPPGRFEDERLPEYEPPPVVWAPDLAKPLPPIDWLCEGLRLTAGPFYRLSGTSFTAKSAFAQAQALCIAAGLPMLGLWPCKRGRALFIDYDGQGVRISTERAQRFARGLGFDLADLGQSFGYVRPNFYIDEHGAEDRLLRMCEGISFAAIDSWRGATPNTDEWKRGPVQLVADRLTRVTEKVGTVFEIVDHDIKPARDGKSSRSSMHDTHGSSAKSEVAQGLYTFASRDGEIVVTHTKERVLGRPLEPFAFRLEDVERDGDPRWGLRLVSAGLTRSRPTAKFDALKESILETVRSTRGLTSLNRICAKVAGGGKDTKLEAIRELIEEGKLAQPGGEGSEFRVIR